MNNKLLIPFLLFLVLFSSCVNEKPLKRIIDESLAFSVRQYSLMADAMNERSELLPRTIDTRALW